MSLTAGTRLGPYEIVSQIGAGGMGEVWRARDAKLGREVAIKSLPAEFADEGDRLARLEREAKLLASLNHPNIASIYGLEEYDGTRFLVLELVEGDTLADRLKRGAIPVEESLALALQIAEALEAAHERGVIHRDLKPANIMVTPEGRIKVLDFGLAKAFIGDRTDVSPSNSPTRSTAAPQSGIILGTAAYMSPEQAGGDTQDTRTDIWAFGVVLFEMLTGRGLFTGQTLTHVLASVLKEEPDWERLPPHLHPRIRFLLERCLEKQARERCQSMTEACVDIRKALADPGVGRIPSVPDGARPSKLPWIAAVLAATLAAVGVWNLKPEGPGETARFPLLLPDGQVFTYEDVSNVAVSRDGRSYVYVASGQLYLRSLSESVSRPVPGVEPNPTLPAISPDGRRLAYVVEESDDTPYGPYFLKTISLDGGSSRIVLDGILGIRGLSWLDDDTLLFVWQGRGIVRIPASGGEVTVLVQDPDGLLGEEFGRPQLLPGGDRILFSARPAGEPSWDAARIVVHDSASGERTDIGVAGGDARYLPTGHLVFARENTLYALPFDIRSLTQLGGPAEVERGLKRSSTAFSDTANYALSEDGDLVYASVAATGEVTQNMNTTLSWVDLEGTPTPIPGTEPRRYRTARIAPGGDRVALVIADDVPNIWTLDLETGNLNQLTSEADGADSPVWELPDGERIFYRSLRDGAVYSRPADGGEPRMVASLDEYQVLPLSMTGDGTTLAVRAATDLTTVYPPSPETDFHLAVVSMDEAPEFTRLPAESPFPSDPAFSPTASGSPTWKWMGKAWPRST